MATPRRDLVGVFSNVYSNQSAPGFGGSLAGHAMFRWGVFVFFGIPAMYVLYHWMTR